MDPKNVYGLKVSPTAKPIGYNFVTWLSIGYLLYIFGIISGLFIFHVYGFNHFHHFAEKKKIPKISKKV